MERTPTFLAAVASAGVPGLDPVSVEALPSVPEQDYDVAFVQDTEHRRWVVRAPRSELAAARMDLTVTLLQMLARRLPFTVPAPRGFVELKGGGRAMVYPYLPGHNLAFDTLPAGAGPAAELGRALAALHNTDARLFDEAGMPSYDADAYRTRRLAQLDRAAESGRVPTALLARWEQALEDVALWRFAPTPIHGDLTGDQVLAVFEDDSDASTGRIRGITGWEDAKVADPADDFAALVEEADPATLETVLEAYAHARVERPDPNLLVRARLAAELNVLAQLMRADSRGDDPAVEGLSSRLRRLDEDVHDEDPADDYRRTSLTPVALRGRATPPPAVAEDDDEDEDVEFEPTPEHAAEATEVAEETEPAEKTEPAEPLRNSALGLDLDYDDSRESVMPDETYEEDDPHTDDLDSVIEDASHDDEVAWTPRTFGSASPTAVQVDNETQPRPDVVPEPEPDEEDEPKPDEEDEAEDLSITRPIPGLASRPHSETEPARSDEDAAEAKGAPQAGLTPKELPREGR